ncbi:hypothetical protein [uncultured Methanoregula sp.]|uniref:hypothetical protein n=1 Tax=uncultured Methanoregula sp. TaxID=1005933 RepID=UPI002AAA7335|nr:hypothetical protein [uncultured Methanoregula sp.]
MSARHFVYILSFVLIGISVLAVGCVSTNVEDVGYRDGNVSISITSSSGAADAYIQVTVYKVKDLRQEEVAVFGKPVTLVPGENLITIPGQMTPGQYKLCIYVIQNSERRAAVIRDIWV